MLQNFQARSGFTIRDGIEIINGNGVPGSVLNSQADKAPVGSNYTDLDNGDFYTKVLAGLGTDKWERQASETYVDGKISLLATGISWREPVVRHDDVSVALPTGPNLEIQGHTVVDGDRVLFSALPGAGEKNIYVYDGGTDTFVEEPSEETTGDTTYVEGGTYQGLRFTYNGTVWVRTDSSSIDAIDNLNAFVGKPDRTGTLPDYTSTNYVADADDLVLAVSKLDTAIKTNADNLASEIADTNTDITNLQTELDATQSGAGLAANGAYVPNAATTYLQGATSLKHATEILDVKAKQLEDNNKGSEVDNITSVTPIDTIDTSEFETVQWVVQVREVANPGNRYAAVIFATTDGTDVDFSFYAENVLGNDIANLDVTVVMNNGNMELRITSGVQVDAKAKRSATVAAF